MSDVQHSILNRRSNITTQNGNPANHLFAYAVEEYDAGNGKKAKTWTRIGAAFPHRGESHCDERRGTDAEAGPAAASTTREPPGTGFNIQLRAFPLDGRIVLLPPDPANAEGERSNKDR